MPGELRWHERSGNEHRLKSSQQVKVSPGWHALELGTKASDGPQKPSHPGCAKRDNSSNQIAMKKD